MGTIQLLVGAMVAAAVIGSGTGARADKKHRPKETPKQDAPKAEPDAPVPAAAPKPWANGVSEAAQQAALALFKDGNGDFEESHYVQALAKYREAVKHWDHPAIRFNMAVCLVNLDQPLAAYANLEQALAYEDAPLGEDLYQQGLTYKKLLLGQLAQVKIVCQEEGAEVALDGKKLFTAPGEASQLIAPGNHQVVATKAGFLPASVPLVLLPGKLTTETVKLLRLKDATKMVRRWKVWKPWTIVGAGVLVGLLGVPVQLQSASDFSTYEREIGDLCPQGCPISEVPGDVQNVKSRAGIENVVAISLFATGGVTAVVGLVMVFLNSPRGVLDREKARAPSVTVEPTVGRGGTTLLTVLWTF